MIVVERFDYLKYKFKKDEGKNPHIYRGLRLMRIVDQDESKNNYQILLNDGIWYSMLGKTEGEKDRVLDMAYKADDPIIDGRLIWDVTFITRLLSFLEQSPQDMFDEKDYLIKDVKTLRIYQKLTATDPDEIAYLERTEKRET